MAFRDFLLEEMRARGLSARELARALDVSHTTVNRLLDELEPGRPGLEFIMALAGFVHLPVTRVLEIAYPEIQQDDVALSSEARFLAQRIEQLPDDQRQIIYALLFSLRG